VRPGHAKHLPLQAEDPAGIAREAIVDRDRKPDNLIPFPPLSREVLRSRRKRDVRAKTINVRRMTKRELELGRLLYPDAGVEIPRTRSECAEGPRPCPFVSCAHHLFLDVSAKTGSLKLNFPDLEPEQMSESCALDVADRGGETLENVGAALNMTRERVRQIEVTALAKLQAVRELALLRDGEPGPTGKRRLPMLAAEPFDEDLEDEPPLDATAYAEAHKYSGIEQAEKMRFFSMERLVFVPHVEH
jgi:hypothetical protein